MHIHNISVTLFILYKFIIYMSTIFFTFLFFLHLVILQISKKALYSKQIIILYLRQPETSKNARVPRPCVTEGRELEILRSSYDTQQWSGMDAGLRLSLAWMAYLSRLRPIPIPNIGLLSTRYSIFDVKRFSALSQSIRSNHPSTYSARLF